jgi:uncharacterized protein YecE (DUF72 family)
VRAWSAGLHPPGARRIAPARRLKAERDVFVYFDNDVKVRAPYDAMALAARLGTDSSAAHPQYDHGDDVAHATDRTQP